MSEVADKVRELAELLDRHALTAIKLKNGDLSIELRRDPEPVAQTAHSQPQAAVSQGDGVVVPSPMVGVFYGRPSPTEEPFVKVGDRISQGQVVGVIEAMKVFNEVESPVAGVVREVLAKDGQVVQQGDPLYLLEP